MEPISRRSDGECGREHQSAVVELGGAICQGTSVGADDDDVVAIMQLSESDQRSTVGIVSIVYYAAWRV